MEITRRSRRQNEEEEEITGREWKDNQENTRGKEWSHVLCALDRAHPFCLK